MGYEGAEPVLLVETGTVNDYSLFERPVRDPAEAGTDVDPQEAARQIRGVLERYLDLQPHEDRTSASCSTTAMQLACPSQRSTP
ncbi:hypothetical protein [Chenggangzhangella methanolivorans]|uniref:Uncharacterized protein n=1 Tax=Chenggangzhangella methanolivorans TaxID=1437009 RepID=A0A9E6RFU5_9HYPH|nr:hypothetical protein [Chenggangzhangella methanolivorans]QZO00576.1 hypothetical protein K6K41_02300 [Chenggangzhangella methanolivorans]